MTGAPFLEDVPRAALDRFAAQGAVHRFRRGTYLCHQGDPDGDVFFLVAGRVEISSETANGNRVLHATLDTPGFVGELSALGKMPRTASVLTLDDSDVWSIGPDSFLDFVTAEPAASRDSSRPGAPGPGASVLHGRPAAPRPQGPRREAPPAARDAEPRRSAADASSSRPSRTRTSRACAAAAARTSPGSSPNGSDAGSSSATATATC